jgi:TonB family protein
METTSLISILLKITLNIAIAWGIWFIFLRRVNRFSVVRAYIMISTVTAFLSPWLTPIIQKSITIPGVASNAMAVINIPEVQISATANAPVWPTIIGISYLVICSLFAIRLIYQFYRLFTLAHKSKIYINKGLTIFEHSAEVSPFSFFGYCFINPSDIPSDKLNEVLKHEKAHYQLKHSFDIVLMEIISIVQWFNPFYWMLRKALVEVHEYQADNAVINSQSDPHTYLDTIISIAFHGIALPIGNNFNKSLTLKRLAMMNINSKTKGSIFRLALALIVAIPIVIAISCSSDSKVDENPTITIKPLNEADKDAKGVIIIEEMEIFTVVEVMPFFEGDNSMLKFREYVTKNLRYPEIASKNGIQGRVFVSFIVEIDGKVSNVKVERGVDPSLDKEAIRVVESSPKWIPGKQRGETVRVQFNLPITFTLQ